MVRQRLSSPKFPFSIRVAYFNQIIYVLSLDEQLSMTPLAPSKPQMNCSGLRTDWVIWN